MAEIYVPGNLRFLQITKPVSLCPGFAGETREFVGTRMIFDDSQQSERERRRLHDAGAWDALRFAEMYAGPIYAGGFRWRKNV